MLRAGTGTRPQLRCVRSRTKKLAVEEFDATPVGPLARRRASATLRAFTEGQQGAKNAPADRTPSIAMAMDDGTMRRGMCETRVCSRLGPESSGGPQVYRSGLFTEHPLARGIPALNRT